MAPRPTTPRCICVQCQAPFSATRGGSFCDRCYAVRAAENRRRKYMGLPPLPRMRYSGEERPAEPANTNHAGNRGIWQVQGPHWGCDSCLQYANLRRLERSGGLEMGDRAIAPDGREFVYLSGGLAPVRN